VPTTEPESTSEPSALPYPHARNDCALCRERDAELRVYDAPEDRHSSLLQCITCFGTHLALLAIHRSGQDFAQSTTVLVDLIGHQQHALDAEPAPYRPVTVWESAAGLAYPHRHNDCHACRKRDADLVLLDLEHQPAMRARCAAWNIAGRLATDPATSAEPCPVTVGVAPSRWQDNSGSTR
jgi:hypothetical protein